MEDLAKAIVQLEALGLPVLPLIVGAAFGILIFFYVKRERGDERSGPARCALDKDVEMAHRAALMALLRRVELLLVQMEERTRRR